MLLTGGKCRLRAVEQRDTESIYAWENDPRVWEVSGTSAPYSRYAIEHFIAEQQAGIYATHQLRLMIETSDGRSIGMIDLFEFDPVNLRAGTGVLIADEKDRRKGYASEAVTLLCEYARKVLRLHQLWCGVGAANEASLALFRKAGFEQTGRRREWLMTDTGWQDQIEFQKIL